MALSIGTLTGFIRIDPDGVDAGLRRAEARLRAAGQRMGDDADDNGSRIGNALRRGLVMGVDESQAHIRGLIRVAAGINVIPPIVAAATTAIMGLAAGATAAGIAFGAFMAAAAPQMEEVGKATDLASKAEEAHEQATLKAAEAQKLKAKGGKDYKEAQTAATAATKKAEEADAAYKNQMDKLPPSTQKMAKSLQGLKDDQKKWSDSLADSTMPVFTKGIEILRDLLPVLTPFVRAAAGAFSDLLDKLARGIKSAGFKKWAEDMANAAGPAIRDLGTAIGNFVVGFGALLQAFLPQSEKMTGGLLGMSEAFRDWASNLKGSEGFSQFIDMAKDGGGALKELGKAVLALVVAAAPLMGSFTVFAETLAKIINNTPTGVLTGLAWAITAVYLATKLWAIGSLAVTTANMVMNSSAYLAIAGWLRMMGVGLMVYLRLAAGAVASAATTAAAWLGTALRAMGVFVLAVARAALRVIAQFALMAARAIAWAAVMAAQWLIAMGPIGWVIAAIVGLVAIIIANWDTIKKWTGEAWDWVWGKIKAVGQAIWDFIKMCWDGIKTAVTTVWNAIKTATQAVWDAIKLVVMTVVGAIVTFFTTAFNTIKSIVTTVWNAIKSITSTVWNAIKTVITTIWTGIKTAVTTTINAIKSVVSTVWNGIKSITSSVWGAIKSTVTTLINGAKTAVSTAVNAIKGFFSEGFNKVKSTVSNALSNVVSTIKGLGSKVKSAVSGAASWLVSAGKSIIQGLINGIKAMAGSVVGAVKGVLKKARDLLPFSPAKKGPFSGKGWTLYSGRSIMEAMARGIIQRSKAVQDAMKRAVLQAHRHQVAVASQSTQFQTGQRVSYDSRGNEMAGVQNGYGGRMLNIEHYYESNNGSAKDTATELAWLAKAKG